MDGDHRQGPPPRDNVLLPGFPGRARLQWILLGALAGLVAADGVFWHGLLFNSRIWRVFLWGLVCGGLAIGGFAFWRRRR